MFKIFVNNLAKLGVLTYICLLTILISFLQREFFRLCFYVRESIPAELSWEKYFSIHLFRSFIVFHTTSPKNPEEGYFISRRHYIDSFNAIISYFVYAYR